MKNLKELDVGCDSAIDQMGIKGLDLIKLNAKYNPKIKNVSWRNNLKELNASCFSGIDKMVINGLDLIILDISMNPKIKDASWMKI